MTTIWLGIHEDNHLLTSAQGAFMQQGHAVRWAADNPRHCIYPVTLLPTHRHYKGGEYSLLGHGYHSEDTSVALSAYMSPNGHLWVRPTEMWDQLVFTQNPPSSAIGTIARPRFTPLW